MHFTVPYQKWGMKNPSTLFLRVSDTVEIDLVGSGNRRRTHGAFRSITILRDNSFSFSAVVGAARGKILEFFRLAAGPIDHDAIDAVALFHAESDRQFRLRQIARAAFHHARLTQCRRKDADCCADRVAIGFCSRELETDAAVPGELIVAIEVSGTVVRGDQQIEIAVAIEVAIGQAASNFGLIEASADFRGDLAEISLAAVQEQLRRLGVSHIAANVANSFVDVSVGNGEVEPAVEIDIKKEQPNPRLFREAMPIPDCGAMSSKSCRSGDRDRSFHCRNS